MESKNSDKLTKGDIISFISLLIMGVAVFFGMNLKTLGDKVPSVIVALLLVVLMTVFVFLAAYAKAQDRNQEAWNKVQYAMLLLYVVSLVPCYFYASKFFDIYFSRDKITQLLKDDIGQLDDMFDDYARKCESRCSSYQTTLEAMLKDSQGRKTIAGFLDISPANVNSGSVNQAVESFASTLKGSEFEALDAQRKAVVANVETNILNWNILYLPQYAAELAEAKAGLAADLEDMYTKAENDIERNVPTFNAEEYASQSNLKEAFTGNKGFSVAGLLAVLVLGGLGLVKYLLGERRTVIGLKKGDESSITVDGGFSI